MLINYGPKRVNLFDVLIQQYVIGAIGILVELLDSKQITSLNGVKQYMGYVIKVMELASRYEWQSVLAFDDAFRQLQA